MLFLQVAVAFLSDFKKTSYHQMILCLFRYILHLEPKEAISVK